MRKYFLFTAVAILTATNANAAATNAAAAMSASATIHIPTEIVCSEIQFGDLYTTQISDYGSLAMIMSSDGTIEPEAASAFNLIGEHKGTPGVCTINGGNFSYTATINDESKILLNSDAKAYVKWLELSSEGILTGMLMIDDMTKIQTGQKLTGSSTILFTYE